MNDRAARMQPQFFDGAAGRLFGVQFEPATGTPRASVLIIPPFAEEMNKSRRMLALQARALACAGLRVLMIDLYGTGDSEGDFADARWEIWIDDLKRCASRLARADPTPLSLLGVRIGALLAADLLAELEGVERLALWQPVSSGAQFLTQFLRMKLAPTCWAAGPPTWERSAVSSRSSGPWRSRATVLRSNSQRRSRQIL